MVYETKALLKSLARCVGKSKDVKEAYSAIVEAASVEGLELPSYEEFIKNENSR